MTTFDGIQEGSELITINRIDVGLVGEEHLGALNETEITGNGQWCLTYTTLEVNLETHAQQHLQCLYVVIRYSVVYDGVTIGIQLLDIFWEDLKNQAEVTCLHLSPIIDVLSLLIGFLV